MGLFVFLFLDLAIYMVEREEDVARLRGRGMWQTDFDFIKERWPLVMIRAGCNGLIQHGWTRALAVHHLIIQHRPFGFIEERGEEGGGGAVPADPWPRG